MAWNLEQVEDLVLRQRGDEAIRACQELLAEKEPTSQNSEELSEELANELAEIYYYQGRAYSAKEEYDKAIANFDKALEYQSRDVAAITEKALTLYKQEKSEEAIDCCERAISIEPNYGRAYITKIVVLLSSNKTQAANSLLEYYNAHKDSMKVDTICKNREGYVYSNLGDIQKGLENYEEAIKKAPNNVRAFNNIGNTLRGHGKNEKAIRSYNEALRLKPDYAEAYNNKGNALRVYGKNEKAIRSYNEALRLKPDYALAYYNKGNALYYQGNNKEAISCYNEALRLKSNFAYAYNSKGLVLENQGRNEKAIEYYDEALNCEPDNVLILVNKALSLNKLNSLKAAAYYFEQASELANHSKFGKKLKVRHKNFINTVLSKDWVKLAQKLKQLAEEEETAEEEYTDEYKKRRDALLDQTSDLINNRTRRDSKEELKEQMEFLLKGYEELRQELVEVKKENAELRKEKVDKADVSKAIEENPGKIYDDKLDKLIIQSEERYNYFFAFTQTFNMCFLSSFAVSSGKVESKWAGGLEKEWGDERSKKEAFIDTTEKTAKNTEDAISTASNIISLTEKASDKAEKFIDNFFPSGFKEGAKLFIGAINWGFEKREEHRQDNLVSLSRSITNMEAVIDKAGRELALRGKIEEWKRFEEEKGVFTKIGAFIRKCDERAKSWLGGEKYIEKSVGTRRGMIDASTLVIKCMVGEVEFKREEIDLVKELLDNIGIVENLDKIGEDASFHEERIKNELEAEREEYGVAGGCGITPEGRRDLEQASKKEEKNGEYGGLREEDASDKANNSKVMSLNKIEYDNPEIDLAMKTGDIDALKASLDDSEQEDNPMAPRLETSPNLEELLESNNIDRGALEEILEGPCQRDILDIEASYSGSQIEHQASNNYTNEQLKLSKLGDEENFEENFS